MKTVGKHSELFSENTCENTLCETQCVLFDNLMYLI